MLAWWHVTARMALTLNVCNARVARCVAQLLSRFFAWLHSLTCTPATKACCLPACTSSSTSLCSWCMMSTRPSLRFMHIIAMTNLNRKGQIPRTTPAVGSWLLAIDGLRDTYSSEWLERGAQWWTKCVTGMVTADCDTAAPPLTSAGTSQLNLLPI